MHRPVLIDAPTMTPVSLAETKVHLRVDHTDDDALITSFIEAAVDNLDGWTGILGRCLMEQTWRQDFDAFGSCLHLPLGPVISISSVTVGGDTVDPVSYSLETDAGGRSRVEFDGVSASGAASITYKAGYQAVPPSIKVAIMLMVGNWYLNREVAQPGPATELPFGAAVLLAPYRRVGV